MYKQTEQAKDDRKRLVVRVPKHVHQEAKIKAAREGRSLQDVLAELVDAWRKTQQ